MYNIIFIIYFQYLYNMMILPYFLIMYAVPIK